MSKKVNLNDIKLISNERHEGLSIQYLCLMKDNTIRYIDGIEIGKHNNLIKKYIDNKKKFNEKYDSYSTFEECLNDIPDIVIRSDPDENSKFIDLINSENSDELQFLHRHEINNDKESIYEILDKNECDLAATAEEYNARFRSPIE